MGELPVCSGQAAVRCFEKFGWTVRAQKGSHIIMVKVGSIVTLSVPNHRELDRGTLRALIRSSGLTVDEFRTALK